MRRVGVMGGTFDPIHLGHLVCAEMAREACELDEVLFVVAGNPHFKQGQQIAPIHDRIEMVQAAIKDEAAFSLSLLEADQAGITYTVDTLKALVDADPTCRYSFIMGTDSLLTLPQWKDAETIARLCDVICVTRPGYEVNQAVLQDLSASGFEVTLVEAPLLDISSSEIRMRVAASRSIRYLVPDEVRILIDRTGLYRSSRIESPDGRDCVRIEGDALSDAYFKSMRKAVSKRVSKKRFKHIEGVSDTASALAKTYGCDEAKARLAGILHDWDKGLDNDEIRQKVRELGLEGKIGSWVVANMPQVVHGPTAAAELARDHPEIPADVIAAIDKHTTAACEMSDLDKILYIADALEPTRTFAEVRRLRDMIGTASLDELYSEVYRFWVRALIDKGCLLHPDTLAIWNDLAYPTAHERLLAWERKCKEKKHEHDI